MEIYPRVGINSRMIREISGGPISASEIELIELNADHPALFRHGEVDYEFLDRLRSLGNSFSIHGPYTPLADEAKNFERMEKVFLVAQYLEADSMVVHGDKVTGDYRDALLKSVKNLKQYCQAARKVPITLLLENMVREKRNDRVGVLPFEIRQVIELVKEDNLKFCFDIGHANLAARLYRFEVIEYIDVLAPYLYQMHIHDNYGIPPSKNPLSGDQHLGLGTGKINYKGILGALDNLQVHNLVLELQSYVSRSDALKSIDILSAFKKNRNMFDSGDSDFS